MDSSCYPPLPSASHAFKHLEPALKLLYQFGAEDCANETALSVLVLSFYWGKDRKLIAIERRCSGPIAFLFYHYRSTYKKKCLWQKSGPVPRSLAKMNRVTESINKQTHIFCTSLLCTTEALQVSGDLCKKVSSSTRWTAWSLPIPRAHQWSLTKHCSIPFSQKLFKGKGSPEQVSTEHACGALQKVHGENVLGKRYLCMQNTINIFSHGSFEVPL